MFLKQGNSSAQNWFLVEKSQAASVWEGQKSLGGLE